MKNRVSLFILALFAGFIWQSSVFCSGVDGKALASKLSEILPPPLVHLKPAISYLISEPLTSARLKSSETLKEIERLASESAKLESNQFPKSESHEIILHSEFQFYISLSSDEGEPSSSILISKFGKNVGSCSFEFDGDSKLIKGSCDHWTDQHERDRSIFYNDQAEIKKIDYYLDPPVESLEKIYGHAVEVSKERIKVGIVDSGVDYNHPAIAKNILRTTAEDGKIKIAGRDFMDLDDLAFDIAMDDCASHGTGVASMIASVAEFAELIPTRYPKSGHLYESVEYLVKSGARIINMSLGVSESLSKELRETYERDYERAVRDFPEALFVIAAGNDGFDVEEHKILPQALKLPNMLVVASVSRDRKLTKNEFWGSNFSKNTVQVAALGDEISVAVPGGAFEITGGTSFAAPQLAGLMARYQLKNPNAKPEDLIEMLHQDLEPLESLKEKTLFAGIPKALSDFSKLK